MLHMPRMLPIYGLDLCTFKYNMKIWQNASNTRKKGSSAGNSSPQPPLSLVTAIKPSCWVHIIFHIFFSDTPLATVAVAKGAAGSRTSICKDNAPLSNCQEDQGPRTVYCAEYIKARRVSGSRVWAIDDQLSICLAH